MAAPNLKNPTTITGKTVVGIATTTLTEVLSNGVSSGKVLKINVAKAANTTTSGATVDLSFYRGSTHTYFIEGASVPPNGSLVIIDKNEYAYVEEGDAIYARSNTLSAIDLIIHYEEIS